MPVKWEIKFSPEGTVQYFTGTRGNYYRFCGGSTLDVDKHIVWCPQCRSFTEGELIRSLQELEQQVADYTDVSSAEYQRIISSCLIRDKTKFLNNRLAESNLRLAWRLNRVAPPKCLECGTTDIVDLNGAQDVPSPCSSGTVTIGGIALCSTRFRNYFYTPEGDRIQ